MPITFIKDVDNKFEIVGKYLTYTFTIENANNTTLSSVIVSDNLDTSIDFVEGSVMLNNIAMPDADIRAGVEIGELDIGDTAYVSFRAYIKNNDKPLVANTGLLTYTYIDEKTQEELIKTQDSNKINVFLSTSEVSCSVSTKEKEANLGDIIEYLVVLKNTGNIPAIDVMFFDKLPNVLEFVDNSFRLNGQVLEGADIEDGVYLSDMDINDTAIISYSVKVLGGSYTGFGINKAYTRFAYKLDNYYNTKFGKIYSHKLKIDISSFKQLIINKYLCLTCDSPDIEAIDSVLSDVTIDNYYIINTAPNVSYENQNLTSHKLIIHGTLNISIIYTGLETEQPLHSINQSYPFSTYIILPLDYIDQDIEISTIVEDTTINQVDNRCLDASAAMLVIARFK